MTAAPSLPAGQRPPDAPLTMTADVMAHAILATASKLTPSEHLTQCVTLTAMIEKARAYPALLEALRAIAEAPCSHPGFCEHQIARNALFTLTPNSNSQ